MASSLSPVGFPQQRFMPPSDYPPHFPDELWSRPPELSPLGNLPPFPIRQPLPPFAATHDLDILEQHPFSAPVLSMDMADDACLKEIVGKLPTSLPLPMPQDPPRLHSANMAPNVGNWITPTGTQSAQNNAGIAQNTAGLASLANLSADPGFVERAAKFSSFVSKQGTDLHHQADIKVGTRLPIERMSNSWMRTPPAAMDFSPREHSAEAKTDQSGITSRSPTPTSVSRPGPQKDCTSSTDHTFRTQAQEASTACDQGGSSLASNAIARGPVCKKKRAASKAEGAKDLDMDEVCVKRVKTGDCAVDAVEKAPKPQHSGATSGNSDASTQKTSKESAKVSDVEQPPKPDYVHVRARRGQATDSHSLAERVRREKISERMKYLQDLVPGCSKVTGKAVMLDEIINYVQSLQRQVEFLSMKLAAVYPARMEVSLETLLGKEDIVPQKPLVPKVTDVPFAADNNSSYSLMQYQQLLAPQLQEGIACSAPVDVHPFPTATDTLSQTFSGLASMDTYGDCISQMSQTWEDELQNAMHMSFAQQTPLTSSSLQGPLISGQMKVEL